MSLDTSTSIDDGSAAGWGSYRARFDDWRRGRPFLGAVLLMLAGIVIAYVPLQFATELLLVGGAFTFVGLVFAVFVFLTGVLALVRPDLSTTIGVVGVAVSILSIFGALGGLVVGMAIGIVGGNLCVAWQPTPSSSTDVERNGGGDHRIDPGTPREHLLIEEADRPAVDGSD